MDVRLRLGIMRFLESAIYEAVEKIKALGVKYSQAYPVRVLSVQQKDVLLEYNFNNNRIKQIREKQSAAGTEAVSYGVVDIGKTKESMRRRYQTPELRQYCACLLQTYSCQGIIRGKACLFI